MSIIVTPVPENEQGLWAHAHCFDERRQDVDATVLIREYAPGGLTPLVTSGLCDEHDTLRTIKQVSAEVQA